MTRSLLSTTALAIAIAASSTQAQEPCISTELALVADVSSSMTPSEKAIQREGYSAAFRSGEVLDAIAGSYCGAIAVQYIEFASHPKAVTDWFIIATDEDAEEFAQAIETGQGPKDGPSGGLTGLARAMRFGGKSLEDNGIAADRSVIDVSADGGDNVESTCTKGVLERNAVKEARDKLVTATAENGWREIIINALPIVGGIEPVGTCGLSLSDYMEKFVRGGPGSFLIEANGVSDIPQIVRQKLVQEIG